MGKYFTVLAIPDIVNGTVGNVIGSDTSDKTIDSNDVVFDWVAVDVPSGTCMLRSINMWVNGPDGSIHGSGIIDYDLIFARSKNGAAPPSIGTVNAAASTDDIRDYWIGNYKFDGSAATPSGRKHKLL